MKKLIIFKKFLQTYDRENKLINYLTTSEIEKLKSLPPFIKNLGENKFLKESIIDAVHYSWFIPLLNIYSENEASLFLVCLKPSYRKSLTKLLDLKEIPNNIHPTLKKFLKEILLRSLLKKEDALLPIDSLYESKLNMLLTLGKNKLIKLIDLLSIYDLVKELKFIVEKKKLKKIYSYLKDDEKTFLKTILHYKEPFATQRINIEKFASDKIKFRNLLHRCGLLRLSLALSGESIDLIWYVCHYLDIGRGNFIFKECKTKKVSDISKTITEQILKIINTFK